MSIYTTKEKSKQNHSQADKTMSADVSGAYNMLMQHVSNVGNSVMATCFQSESEQKPYSGVPKSGGQALPSALRKRFEARSNISLGDVGVHRNSSKPADIGAYAYTQGNEIYLAPGQDKHLEHELGHVVQQKQGLVKDSVQIGDKKFNFNQSLEHDADTVKAATNPTVCDNTEPAPVIQGKFEIDKKWNPLRAYLNTNVNNIEMEEIRNCLLTTKLSHMNRIDMDKINKMCDIEDIAEHAYISYFPSRDASYYFDMNSGANAAVCPEANDKYQIKIGDDLIKNFSVGEILGFINHELSVHAVPNCDYQIKESPFPINNTTNAGDNDKQHLYAAGLSAEQPDRAEIYLRNVANSAINLILSYCHSVMNHNSNHYDDGALNLLYKNMIPPKLGFAIIDMVAFYIFDIARMRFERLKYYQQPQNQQNAQTQTIIQTQNGITQEQEYIRRHIQISRDLLEKVYEIALVENERKKKLNIKVAKDKKSKEMKYENGIVPENIMQVDKYIPPEDSPEMKYEKGMGPENIMLFENYMPSEETDELLPIDEIDSFAILQNLKPEIANKIEFYFSNFENFNLGCDINNFGMLGMINKRVGYKAF